MRTPTISVPTRTPTITPSIAARSAPVSVRGLSASAPARVRSLLSRVPPPRRGCDRTQCCPMRAIRRTSIRPARPLSRRRRRMPGAAGRRRRWRGQIGQEERRRAGGNSTPAAVDLRTFANEFVAEIDGALSATEADELARRHGLTRVSSENFPLIGATFGLFRITDGRPSETVRREFAADGSVRSVQPNFRYVLQDQKSSVPTEGDPAQYALASFACRRRIRWRTAPTSPLP